MTKAVGSEWWRGASIYQIYPRSFMDANGDGTGDMQGITQKLDHVAALGVDAIWISPFFKSPMDDFGYDVSDYCDVDPCFGTLADFDALVARAHELGLKVIIDQVYSHSSSEHAWFEESRSSRDNPKADWYTWVDAKPEGSPPNNWQSIFIGPAWTWDARRQQYYLHNFLSTQPDLNLHNPEVQDALLETARFWLDRGVDGFRLDAINYGMHDESLADNPVADPDVWEGYRPVNMQKALYNSNHKKLPEFLERVRALLDEYDDRFTVAEVGGFDAPAVMRTYTQGNQRLNTAYSFEFLGLPEFDANRFAEILSLWPNDIAEGWPSWAFSNHDVPRVASRWGKSLAHRHRCELITLFLISLRGNIFLYQGEEMGLTQVDIPFEKLQDPEAIKNWPHTLGRDGARTPMPWTSGCCHGGFSPVEPWLPVPEEHHAIAADQHGDDSLMSSVKALMKTRSQSEVLKLGDIDDIEAKDDVLSFTRRHGDQQVRVVMNFSDRAVGVDFADSATLIAGVTAEGLMTEVSVSLPAFSGVIGQVT